MDFKTDFLFCLVIAFCNFYVISGFLYSRPPRYGGNQIGRHCYSCSASISNAYSSSGYNCLNNLTAVRTVYCRSGYYCLFSYTVREGIVTYVRRTCQNPLYDHNDNVDTPPTENGCVSSHSRYSSSGDSTTCYYHCTTDKCNKQKPVTLSKCPDECPTTCDPVTGQCSKGSLKCVQCTSESDENCEEKTEATRCPRQTYSHCAATKTVVLDLNGKVVKTAVTKSCTSFSSTYSMPNTPCRFRSTRRSGSNPNFIKYVCQKFCTKDGCNVKLPGGSLPGRIGLRCAVCSQYGSSGSCTRPYQTSVCPVASTHCSATVTYYVSSSVTSSGSPLYSIASIERKCATEPLPTKCTTVSVKGSDVKAVTCQESCQSNNCNNGWPGRPKCIQCDVTNRSYTGSSFKNCRDYPSPPTRCYSPLSAYCTTIFNNTASQLGAPTRIRRGCSATPLDNTCHDINVNGNIINNCQSSCKTDGCNKGQIGGTS